MLSRCVFVLGALSLVACPPPLTGLYSLTLDRGELALFPDETNGCPARPEVSATQDGVPLKQTSPGGRNSVGVLFSECSTTTWAALPIAPTDASTTFVLKDTLGHVVTAEFAAVMGQRGLTLISPATPSARLGDAIVLEWSPATDILDAPILPFTDRTTVSINFEESPTLIHMVSVGATLAGQRVSFTLDDPLSLPQQTTTGTLQVTSFGQQSGALRCEGVPHCVSPLQVPIPALPFTVVR